MKTELRIVASLACLSGISYVDLDRHMFAVALGLGAVIFMILAIINAVKEE